MTNFTITQALMRLRVDAEFSVLGDDLSAISWLDQVQTRPTDQEIEAEVAVVEAEIAAGVFQVNRDAAYRERGLTTRAMVEALWQKVMEADSTTADDLQTIRDQVKSEYPEIQS